MATDDHQQWTDHGDFGHAVRGGFVSPHSHTSLGRILAGEALGRNTDARITIVDLTGLPVLDLAIATLAVETIETT
ncbi:hypothetical protein LB524_23305 [Mesorhizobium sp. ESP6-5]|uniref:hypothetical protein n=1 Tax=Mesorhizobium sp. ESP6-5 TaxID=2876623 RepID=UPI001CCC2D03|nr:hypothetical protein [Mesorhizobium sp. ESP6-5]MBZ9758218.1 hypothetical protein [Mesorhizobium sp. ESP6-5]